MANTHAQTHSFVVKSATTEKDTPYELYVVTAITRIQFLQADK